MSPQKIKTIVDFATDGVQPDITFLLAVPVSVSKAWRATRAATMASELERMEQASGAFFQRVARGYKAIAKNEPRHVKVINAAQPVEAVTRAIFQIIMPLLWENEARLSGEGTNKKAGRYSNSRKRTESRLRQQKSARE
jgi:dTMP kinase